MTLKPRESAVMAALPTVLGAVLLNRDAPPPPLLTLQ
jgi:hypothetical protein